MLRQTIKNWKKTNSTDLDKEIQDLKKLLENCEIQLTQNQLDKYLWLQENELQDKIRYLYTEQKIYWSQILNWTQFKDKNTNIFR